MKPFVRSILFSSILAIVASSSTVAQTSNAGFEQWYRAKYGRPSPSEQASLKNPQSITASLEATTPTIVVSANGGFEQWYRAKYGRPSPAEEARLETQQVNSASAQATTSTAASASGGFEQRYLARYGHQSLTEQASVGKMPTTEHLSKHQLGGLIATAKTPAEHQRIAQFYQSQAQNYRTQSKEHALEAEQSKNNPMRSNNKDVFSTVNHCEHSARKFSDMADKSQELSKQHADMAGGAGQQSGF
jgi:hypothetical protein